ncbi:MAG: hypothetical protein AAB693_03065 [Patescibacteria group bacterium]
MKLILRSTFVIILIFPLRSTNALIQELGNGLGKWKQIFWEYGFPFSSAVSFGEISNSARRKNSKSKFKTHFVSGIIPFLYFSGCVKFKGRTLGIVTDIFLLKNSATPTRRRRASVSEMLRISASGISARATSA